MINKGCIYIVGTPIGNLEDITLRAIKTLKQVDFIAAEDTRVTVKLLNYYNIKNNLISYHEHSSLDKLQQIINKVLDGQSCAIVSDAGMPCISDPGEKLVKLAIKNNINVSVVPGPCAAIAGLSISGLDTSQFVFEGFLSVNKKNRLEKLNNLKQEKRTIIFYEAPHKLKKTLKDLLDILGDRNISIIKEITKIHENATITTLREANKYFESIDKIKGEFVLILEGDKKQKQEINIDEAVLLIKKISQEKNISLLEATKIVAQETGLKKNNLYKLICINKT